MSFPSKTVPWKHQITVFDQAKVRDGSLLAPEMGTGKSMIAISLLKYWESKKVLIVCPHTVIGVWPNQFNKHSLDVFDILLLEKDSRKKRVRSC